MDEQRVNALAKAWIEWEATPGSRGSHDHVVAIQRAMEGLIPPEKRNLFYDVVARRRREAINAGIGRSLEMIVREAVAEVLA